tara:strand:- start:109 stop:735 length:627 start_codon:yes stop_codon:yes gene_type:complete
MGILSKVAKKLLGGTTPPGKKPGVGKRFSDRENTQTGSINSRKVTKKGATNKNDSIPAFTKADVIKDQQEDLRVLARPKKVSEKVDPMYKEQAQRARDDAKNRAVKRTAVRGAAVTASPVTGFVAADYANEKMKKTPAGAATAKAKTSTTSKASKAATDGRKNKEDYPTYKKGTESSAAFRKAFKNAKDDGAKTFTFEGRKYTTADKK